MKRFYLSFLLLGSTVSSTFAQKYYDFTIMSGPAILKQYQPFKFKNIASQIELNYKIQYTKRSSLLLGLGYLSFNKRNRYDVDTTITYQYIAIATSRVIKNSHQLTRLFYLPVKYSYQFMRKPNYDLSIMGGIEFLYFIRDHYSGIHYLVLPSGYLNTTPTTYKSEKEEIGSKYMQLAPCIGLNYRTHLVNKWYLNANASINFEYRISFLRCGIGVSYVQEKFKRPKKKKLILKG